MLKMRFIWRKQGFLSLRLSQVLAAICGCGYILVGALRKTLKHRLLNDDSEA